MTQRFSVSRRCFGAQLVGATAAAALPFGFPVACAQTAGQTPNQAPGLAPDQTVVHHWQELAQISADARKLGLDVPVITSSGKGNANYRSIFPAIVDFTEKLGKAAARDGAVPQDAVNALRKRATDLLGVVHREERMPRERSDRTGAHGNLLALLVSPANAQSTLDERFRKYHDGYLQLFDSCSVRAEHASEVDWYMSKLTSETYRARYETVGESVCVPWYFIGIVHALEASFNFDGHLHNGDPLSDRTVDVPANRPPVWQPPNDWESSARDALEFEKFTNQLDWSLAHTLFRYEAYNGFRSRELHGINTPYLWSFSNHYDSGKFVADGVWSTDAVSKQCGAGVLLHELVARNIIQFTA